MREDGRPSGTRWGALDCLVALLVLPSLVLLALLLLSAGEAEVGPTPEERTQVLATACVLLVASVAVCCYVTRRLGLSCCVLGGKTLETEELLIPCTKKDSAPPVSYDTFISMEPSCHPLCVVTKVKDHHQEVTPAGVHVNNSWGQRASMEQGCYQNLRPQEDNG